MFSQSGCFIDLQFYINPISGLHFYYFVNLVHKILAYRFYAFLQCALPVGLRAKGSCTMVAKIALGLREIALVAF